MLDPTVLINRLQAFRKRGVSVWVKCDVCGRVEPRYFHSSTKCIEHWFEQKERRRARSLRQKRAIFKRKLYNKQEGRCGICGGFISLAELSSPKANIDHIIPRSRGGSDKQENLQLTHTVCNEMKGNSLPEEFMPVLAQ